jgi:hypothetical protein
VINENYDKMSTIPIEEQNARRIISDIILVVRSSFRVENK